MADNPKPVPDMTAQFDQIQTHTENIAWLVASYYRSLVKAGVPDKLAYQLVIDFNIQLWAQIKKGP